MLQPARREVDVFIRALLGAAALAALVTACDGDDDDTPTPEPTGTPEDEAIATTEAADDFPQYAYYRGAPETGVAAVDDAIVAYVDQRSDDLVDMVRPSMVPCVEERPEGQLAPLCGDDEEEGTPVEALPTGRCVPGAVLIDDVPALFRAATGPEPAILAVYEHFAESEPVSPDAGYGVVIVNRRDENAVARLDLDDQGIVGIHLPCVDRPYELYDETVELQEADASRFLLPLPHVD